MASLLDNAKLTPTLPTVTAPSWNTPVTNAPAVLPVNPTNYNQYATPQTQLDVTTPVEASKLVKGNVSTATLPQAQNNTVNWEAALRQAMSVITPVNSVQNPTNPNAPAGFSDTSSQTQTGTPDNSYNEKLISMMSESLGVKPTSQFDNYQKFSEAQGLAEKQQTVNDLTAQLNAISARTQSQVIGLEGQGRGIPQAILGGQAAQLQRQAAIEALPVAAQLSAAQGNLQTAQQQIETLMGLQKQDDEAMYRYRKDQRDYAMQSADKAEEKIFKEQQRADDLAKEERDNLQNLKTNYVKAAIDRGDFATASKISSATTSEELQRYAGSITGMTLDDQYKTAQIANIQSEIQSRGGSGSTEEASNILAYAQQYASTGNIPTGLPKGTFGIVSQVAKELPRQPGQVMNTLTGLADSKTPATEQADYARLNNILQNTKRLKELEQNKIGGVVSGTLGKIFGSEAQGEYLATRKAIVDDMSRMQSGAALTKEEIAQYEDYLPGRFSNTLGLGLGADAKIANFEKIINNRLTERLATNGLSIDGFSKIKLGGVERTVGEVIESNGVRGRVNSDGSITLL